jgi:hypothetical protein
MIEIRVWPSVDPELIGVETANAWYDGGNSGKIRVWPSVDPEIIGVETANALYDGGISGAARAAL